MQEKREKYMYIMHENVSFYFQWSGQVQYKQKIVPAKWIE